MFSSFRKAASFAAVAVGLAGVISGAAIVIGGLGSSASAGQNVSLIALVAPNAKDSFDEIVHAYGQIHPSVSISTTYAGSKIIASTVATGAAADVVLLAQSSYDAAGGTLGAPAPAFTNHLAICVARKAAGVLHTESDLAKPGVRLVGGSLGSVVAQFQSQAVSKMTARLGPAFEKGYTANIATLRTDTGSASKGVEAGLVDAGILYDASCDTRKVAMIKLDPADDVVVPAVVATVKASDHAEDAREFAKFVTGPTAAAIFRAHRHSVPTT